jgi:hypothetical protein
MLPFAMLATCHTASLQVLVCDEFDWSTEDSSNLPAVCVAPDSLAYIIFTSGSVRPCLALCVPAVPGGCALVVLLYLGTAHTHPYSLS